MKSNILITGGAGYIGAVLVPKLLNKGHRVKVIDLYIYGEDVLDNVKTNPNLSEIKGSLVLNPNLCQPIVFSFGFPNYRVELFY